MSTFAGADAAIQKTIKASNHWPLLDFMRATAALLVVFAHSRPYFFQNIPFADQSGVFLPLFYLITGLGHESVLIFFVLSGFLIGGSLTDSMQKGSFDLSRYFIARFTRIYIVYIPALIITQAVFLFGLLTLTDPGAGPTWIAPLFNRHRLGTEGVSQAICHLAGLTGFSCPVWEMNPPLWSLGFEWALYLFAPAIIQLIVWKASLTLRVLGLTIVCAIVATLCQHPNPIEAMTLVGAWFLGAGSYRMLRAGLVPLPVGLVGVGVIVAGTGLRFADVVSQPITDVIITIGATTTVACRELTAFPLAPRFFAWAAGFSFSLYAIHAPFIYFAVTLSQQLGFPLNMPPSPTPFMELALTVSLCLSAAYLFSLVTERKTKQVRDALVGMYSPIVARKISIAVK